ncbi:MAG TPA: SAM-dependent methyltransferase [Aldersonia sp.]
MTVHVDLELYERALSGEGRWALTAPGTSRRRPTDPGLGPHGLRAADRRVDRDPARRCDGPSPDVGCPPGPLVAERGRRGSAPGIDIRGATRRHDVFGQVPGAGRWHYTLPADGNLGIGGDPVPILPRTRGPVHLETRNGIGPWFPWARVGIERAADLAAEAALRARDTTARAGRHIAWLGAQ